MFPLLSFFSLLLSLPCFASLLSPFLLQEILTIAVQSVSPLAGGSKDKLGWDWMLDSTGSSSVTSKQRMLFPTSKVLLHTQQTGGQKSLSSYRWSCLWSWHIQKIVWQQPLLWVRVADLQFHVHCFKVRLVTVQKADREFLWPRALKESLARTWKVGLDRWWDEPNQTLSHRINLGVQRLLLFEAHADPRVTTCCLLQNPERCHKIPLNWFKLFLNNPCVFCSYWKHLPWNNKCQIPPRNLLECRNWWSQILVMMRDSTVETAGVLWEGDHFRNITIWPAWSCALLTLLHVQKNYKVSGTVYFS